MTLENDLLCNDQTGCIVPEGQPNAGEQVPTGAEYQVQIESKVENVTVDSVLYTRTTPQFNVFRCNGTEFAFNRVFLDEANAVDVPVVDTGTGDTDVLDAIGPFNLNYDTISSMVKISPKNVCKFNFNFHNPKYESFISNSTVPHNLLPSFYANAFWSENKTDESIRKALTLDDAIDLERNKILSTPSSTAVTLKQEYELKKYFVDYIGTLTKNIEDGILLPDIQKKMSYIFVAPEQYAKFKQLENKKDLFPFYNEINIPAKPTGKLGKFLEKYKKFDDFKLNQSEILIPEIEEKLVKITNESTIDKRISEINVNIQAGAYTDIDSESNEYFFFEEGSGLTPVAGELTLDYISNLISDISFNNAYGQEYDRLFLNYDDQPEVLYYKVVKYKDSTSNEPVSIFCVPNTENVNNISYIDTQIKINENYIYKIYAIVYVQKEGSQFLIQEEMTEVNSYTLNHPPMIPDFNVLPVANSDRHIRVLFNESVGQRLLEPVSLTVEEEQRIEKLRAAQGRINTQEELDNLEAISQERGFEFTEFGTKIFDNKIMFKDDDDIKIYEIYRLETPPRVVEDFRAATKIRISSDSFIDTIEKNTKYYYMFRAIDSHGNISNPSSVIEVILVSNGYNYPIIKPYHYEDHEQEKKIFSKQAKKYVRISPLPSNLLVTTTDNASTATEVTNATLSDGNIPLWGKEYKMRVTSKATGKKIDFNFTFKQNFFNSGDDVV